MAPVLAVALVLLCGSVPSAEGEVMGYVTQVKPESSNDSATAPAITSVTGSNATHSAVLSDLPLGESMSLEQVDLARADDEDMTMHLTSAPAPSPSEAVPEGFDMANGEAPALSPSTEEEAPEPVAPEEDSAEFAALGPDTAPHGNDPSGEGKVVSGYPELPAGQDFSNGDQYGVNNPTTLGSDGDSLSALSENSTDPSEDGKVVSGYPELPAGQDFSNGDQYGVNNPTTLGSDGDSLSALSENSTDPSEDGKVVSGYPELPAGQDFSNGDQYGVINPTGEGATTQYEAVSESGTSETTGVMLSQSRVYSPPPKSNATWGIGKCTFYGGMDASGTMSGACGYGNLYASGYGAYTAALSSALFRNGMACGACYEVACSGNPKACKSGSVLVTVTNFCPPNPGQSAYSGGWCNGANRHFDLTYPAFVKIADPTAVVVDLKYRRVPCQKKGGIRFTLNGNCNFNLVTITNVAGSGVVTEAYMKGDGMDWAPMSRNWGANWQCGRNYCGKGISIKVVTSDNKVSVSRLAGKDWAFGKTYIGQQIY